MMRLGGSIGGPGAARSCLLLDRDPDDPDQDRGTRRVWAHFKCNCGPLQPSRLLRVEEITLPADSLEPEVTTARIVDVGESPHAAAALLAAGADDHGAGTDAVDFLVAELGDGIPVEATVMLKRAKEAGINESTLNRAKKRAGVVSERIGFAGDGRWMWQLKVVKPPSPSSTATYEINDDEVAINGAKAAKALIDGHGGDTSAGGTQ
jgi:hypothetical protein